MPTIPGVVLETEIGRGGFATVYRAHQVSVGRTVAVKIDDRVLAADRDRRRFVRETTAAGALSAHPHIVTLYDAGITDDGRPYLVMEHCPEGSLATKIRESGPIPVEQALTIGFAIADALVAAHAVGILHRDVKPGNILLTQYGTPALADFGLAVLPRTDESHSVTLDSLTPSYSPPEAFERRPPTESTDIYALGATLYGLMLGRAPHSEVDGTAPPIPRLLFLLNQPLPALPVPGSEAAMEVIWRATAADPADRFASATEFRDALAAAARGQRPPRRPATPPGSVLPAATSVVAQPKAEHGADPASTELSRLGRLLDASADGDRTERRAAAARSRWPLIVAAAVAALLAGVAAFIATRGPETPVAGLAAPVATAGSVSASDSIPRTTESSTGVPASSAARIHAPATSAGSQSTTSGDQTTRSAPSAPAMGSCWSGMMAVSGEQTARELPCDEPHYWETFATGLLTEETATWYIDDVLVDPHVNERCSKSALSKMLKERGKPGGPGLAELDIDVLPPRGVNFHEGERGFWCIASVHGAGQTTGSLFAAG